MFDIDRIVTALKTDSSARGAGMAGLAAGVLLGGGVKKAITYGALAAIGSVAYKPEDIYAEVNNIAPDLIVYFDNLSWRSLGSLGTGQVHTFENDTGPDDANHAQEGLYIYYNPQRPGEGSGPRRHLMDVAPTLLDLVGVDVPKDMRGSSFA